MEARICSWRDKLTSDLETSMSFAPSLARECAIASPMPIEAPVYVGAVSRLSGQSTTELAVIPVARSYYGYPSCSFGNVEEEVC